jgi:hypothetical protein
MSVSQLAVLLRHPSAPPATLMTPEEYFAMKVPTYNVPPFDTRRESYCLFCGDIHYPLCRPEPLVSPPSDPRDHPVADKYAQTTATKVAARVAQYTDRITLLTSPCQDEASRERLLTQFQDEPIRQRDMWDDVREAYASLDEPEKIDFCHDIQRAIARARVSSMKRAATKLLHLEFL